MRKFTIGLLMAAMLPSGISAQRIQQTLGRAVVAVTDEAKADVLVTWRKLAQEPEDCTYNLYARTAGGADYAKVNAEPIAKTNYQTTRSAVPYGTELAVTTVSNGVESEKSRPFLFERHAWKDVFIDIDFEMTVLDPDNYKVSNVWPMDLDGNGEFDALLVNRLHTGTDNPDPGYDGLGYAKSHKLQAYTLDGTCLWTVDMGPNVVICAGQNDLVLTYDINCDGKCEVIVKSSDGTRFWDAAANTWGKYANGSTTADTDGDGLWNYRQQNKRNPPFYVSVLDGRTGAEIDCSELNYDEIKDGVDTYSRDNRADYFDDSEGTEYAFLGGKFAVCYFDGTHPSLAVQCYNRNKDTGHHYYVLEWKYDWTGGKPSNWHHSYTWPMKSADKPCAEFHQLRVADVDGDGIDEVMEGGYAVNSTKGLVMSPGIGHGDRFDVGDIDPDRPGMEVYAIQQTNLLGQLIYDAATGEHVKEWYLPSIGDVGRGRCIDIDPTRKGYEVFSTMANLYDCKGNIIKEGSTTWADEAIWWDGDLQRELISSKGGSGYDTNVRISKYDGTALVEFFRDSQWTVHSGWGNRPAFMGDMTGDWREEIIVMKQSSTTSTGIVGYSTDISTEHSMYTLQEDPAYRLDCNTRGYYQMPCTSFYLGGDMPYPPLPPTVVTDLRWQGGAAWGVSAAGFSSFDQSAEQTFADGKTVVFDMSGDNTQPIVVSGKVSPAAVYVMNPKGHDYVFGGTGKLAGAMELWKSMQGQATFDNDFEFTGRTIVSEGVLCANGRIAGPVELRARGSLAGTATVGGDVTFEGALNYEGCRLMPGSAADKCGTMTFGKSLVLPGNIYIEVCAEAGKSGKIMVEGDLTLEGENTFTVNQGGTSLAEGSYTLAECTGNLTADVAKIKMRGLEGVNYTIAVEGKCIVLKVNATRAPLKDVVWTGNATNVWDYKGDNFKAGGVATPFVTGDEVLFDDGSGNRDITVNDVLVTGGVTFDFDGGSYSFSGNGGISGTAGLTKNGRGEVRMALENSDYTGPTVVNEGTLTVTNIADGGKKSAIGASTAAEGNLQLNGGTLRMEIDNTATDHIVTLSDTATICVANANGSLSLKGMVKGDGYLVKDGPGQINFTYEGTNPFAGIIVRQGKIATGAWNSTFGKIGSPMVLEGGTVDLLDVNNSNTRPVFNYATTVVEGTSNTVMGTTRGAINGSFKGKGNLTIVSDGVRNDIGADFSAFEGTLTAQGSNFRLMDNVTDMAKTRLVMAAGSVVSHFKSNSGNTSGVTTRIGSLESTATDCKLGNSADSYEVGYDNTDVTYKGLLTAKAVSKYGTGVWTLSTEGSTSSVTVMEGTLRLYNNPYSSTPSAFSTGTVMVKDNGTLAGTGGAGKIVAYKGGVIAAGNNGGYGTLKATGTVTMFQGSTIAVKVGRNTSGSATNDKFCFGGKLSHSGDTILVKVDAERELAAGDEIRIFTGTGAQSGSYVLKTVCDGRTVTWDDSALLTEGVLRVVDVTGINGVTADGAVVDVYTTDGMMVRDNADSDNALDGLPAGVYVVNGKKVIKK